MKNTFILGVLVVVVLGLVAGGFWLYKNSNSGGTPPAPDSNSNSNSDFPAPASGSVPVVSENFPDTSLLDLAAKDGVVTVKNFYKNIVASEEDSLVIARTTEYFITYQKTQNYFWIAITGGDFKQSRLEAESAILTLLGISKEDACRLDISVGAPYGSQIPAGEKSGLSFCQVIVR